MNMRLIDGSWPALGYTNGQGLQVAKAKLEQVREMHRAISADQDRHAADCVLANGLLERALERCLQIHEGRDNLDSIDLAIFFHYAHQAAKDAEAMLKKDFPHLASE